MNAKLIRRHVAVLTATAFVVLTVLFALLTVTSSAADVIIETDSQGNRTITMSGSTYDEQIVLDLGTTTTINISGDNELTYGNSTDDPCITGGGHLAIVGDGTLNVTGGHIECRDFAISGGAKLNANYGLDIFGSATVNDAYIDSKYGYMYCNGSYSDKSPKFTFNNSELNIGLELNGDTVLNDCNVTMEDAILTSDYGGVMINGGTYIITQDLTKQTPSMSIYAESTVKVKDAAIKTNTECYIENLNMNNSSLEITGPKIPDGDPGSYWQPALEGNNMFFSGSKIVIDGADGNAGISAREQLIMENNTEADIKGVTYGIAGRDVKITHSIGTFQATGSVACAAVAGINYNGTAPPNDFSGTITLNDVTMREPAGGTIGKIQDPTSSGGQFWVAAIMDGKNSAKTVVLEVPSAPKPTPTPTPTTGDDGTVFGKGASVEAAEAAILGLPNDNDPAGTAFGLLQLKATKVTKKSINLKWKAVPGAAKYIIFANKCGTGNKYKKLGEVTGTSLTVTQAAGAALQKGTYYKFMMIAADANGKVITTSKTVHAATKGGKVGNHKKVTVKKSVTKKAKKLKKGKTLKLKAKAVPQAKKLKVRKHRGIKYETSNPAVAQVNGKGAVKGVGKGTCYIYAYAQNGTCTKVKVTVK